MNVGTLLGLIACMGFTTANVLKAENQAVTRSVISSTINKTVESLRVKLAEYDPVQLVNKSLVISEFGNFEVKKIEASGFSNFALTSLSASALLSTVSGTFNLPNVSASVESATLTSDALDVEAEISSLSVVLSGTTVTFSLKYSLSTLQLTSISVLPQIQGLDFSLKGSLNGESSELTITSEDIVDFINEFFTDYQDSINSGLLSAINYLLSLLNSSSSS